jgi:lysosomal-associated membrane protein 1/2
MKLYVSLLFGSAVLISVLCHGYGKENDERGLAPETSSIVPTEPTSKTSEDTTTTKESTTKTTEPTTTTAETTTKTTEHASTTTESTTKTTEHTTRTTEPTTTNSSETTRVTSEHTSPSMATSTVQPISTTAPPTPPIQPVKYMWNVTENNVTCILLEAGIRIIFSYQMANHTVISGITMDLPNNTIASGTCGVMNQTISLSFFEDWNLHLTFVENTTTHKYDLAATSLDYKITSQRFPGANDSAVETVHRYGDMFATDDHKKFVCVAVQTLYSNNNVTDGPEKIDTYSLTFEAFRQSSTGQFTDNAKHCDSDEVSQLVPIIVGAALGGLILIVLIAYLIGRKRSRRGYESV